MMETEDHEWYARYRRRVEIKKIVRTVAADYFWRQSPPEKRGKAYVRFVAKQYRKANT
jgi:hypothetical protein